MIKFTSKHKIIGKLCSLLVRDAPFNSRNTLIFFKQLLMSPITSSNCKSIENEMSFYTSMLLIFKLYSKFID